MTEYYKLRYEVRFSKEELDEVSSYLQSLNNEKANLILEKLNNAVDHYCSGCDDIINGPHACPGILCSNPPEPLQTYKININSLGTADKLKLVLLIKNHLQITLLVAKHLVDNIPCVLPHPFHRYWDCEFEKDLTELGVDFSIERNERYT